ncbi:MAG TPA: transglycosylase SLT domain-containing protein [Rhodanobacteraceae bacterium]|jgi:membrane-bound lytic murein transglycosylase D|nr:transglycosylase SLT domain-containing protein [Rhodanobacteraceae bacterium]
MSPRHASRLGATLAACALLAACAVGPTRPTASPAVVTPRPEPPPTTVVPLVRTPQAGVEPWASLTASFVMHDCNDSPLVRAKLAMYTRSPAHFEQMVQQALPLMLYVKEQLQTAGIPGEFVMLPMLESSYNASEPSRRGDPAGMWQLMPRTARAHGITIDRRYDGRLDPVASTRVAVKMLAAFGKRFDDWRLADMAYNAGQYAVLGALRHHPDLGDGAIPDIPVSSTTRNHLAKLMALNCILREPERFHVELPQALPSGELVTIRVPAGMRLDAAARGAQVSEAKLRALNPGYLGTRVPADSPRTLLLPPTAAGALAAALEVDDSETVAQVDTFESASGPNDSPPLPAEPTQPPGAPESASGDASATHATAHHRVRKGESLWSIAHRYHVTVDDLKRWNELGDDDIRPGEELRVQG